MCCQEHPYLHRPWFMLHPCGTSSIMSLMSTERLKQKSRGYATPPEPRKRGEGEDKQAVPSRSSDLEFDTKLEFIPSIREAPTNQVGNYRDQYLLTWLSFVGPAVRLPVPLDLFKSLNWLGGISISASSPIIVSNYDTCVVFKHKFSAS